ncbi:MAG: L-lysine 6-transaminase [Phycisphaerae bacterium]|nr:MAG: L-lysine 6-transaminase [Planctomycetia bacterium]RIK69975.1 MAG: L-lysine 6-transaminase [Planctomycetota bacterium]GJQ27033.1 MAG: L-lysine 6-transaminase [Phycisphaerae bacterium]
MNTSTHGFRNEITARDVLTDLKKHILVDGFEMVFDRSRSRGCYFFDASTNRTMIDMYGFYASLPIGFNHPHFDRPDVREDLLDAAMVKVANSDVYTAAYARFVNTFSRVLGVEGMERYFFIEGGALGVENALKAAMDWKVQKNIAAGRGEIGTDVLHFKNCFHGRTGYTMSLTNTDPNKVRYFAKFDWPRVSAPPIDFALPEPQRSQRVVADEKQTESEILAALAARPNRICCVIIEPIQGEGGDRHFRPEFFQTLRRLCDQHDMLLIFDEVQCGMGVTGRNWCFEHFGVRPDIFAFAKKVQLAGIMAGPRLDEVPENVFRKSSRINSTWGGNLVDMVRSTHLLTIYERENLADNARRMGERFLQQLQNLAAEEPCITAVRGRGLMLAFDLPDTETRNRFWKACWQVGLLVIRCGEKSIRLRPVLDVKAELVDEVVGKMREALRAMR